MVLEQFRFVEIGRVAFITYGRHKGRLCAIVDVIDQNRALIDGPCTGVCRQQMNFKCLHLTRFKVKIARSVRTGTLKKHWIKEEITEQWDKSTWAKKIADKEKRASMTDFDRFKLMKAKQARNRLIRREVSRLQKEIKKPTTKGKKMKTKLTLKGKKMGTKLATKGQKMETKKPATKGQKVETKKPAPKDKKVETKKPAPKDKKVETKKPAPKDKKTKPEKTVSKE